MKGFLKVIFTLLLFKKIAQIAHDDPTTKTPRQIKNDRIFWKTFKYLVIFILVLAIIGGAINDNETTLEQKIGLCFMTLTFMGTIIYCDIKKPFS